MENSSHEIILQVNQELAETERNFKKLQMAPHLTVLYANLTDINKESPSEFILKWLNHLLSD